MNHRNNASPDKSGNYFGPMPWVADAMIEAGS
jgi:hypothetical protein